MRKTRETHSFHSSWTQTNEYGLSCSPRNLVTDEGQLTENNGSYIFFWKGEPSTDRKIHSVGLAIKTELVKNMNQLPLGVKEWVVTLKLNRCDNGKETFIAALDPTLLADQNQNQEFYNDLNAMLAQVPRKNKILLLGDFNACAGKNYQTQEDMIGKDGTRNCNINGKMLLTKRAKHNLTITNTLFRQQVGKKTSWRHLRSGPWHLIVLLWNRAMSMT